MNLYEVLIPTAYEIPSKRPVSTRHHKKWDEYVRKISGGLTIFRPAKGQWVYEDKLFEDRVIPVRIACTPAQLGVILKFTKKHYRQIKIMAYKISDEVIFYE